MFALASRRVASAAVASRATVAARASVSLGLRRAYATEKPFWRGLKDKIKEDLEKDENIKKSLEELRRTTQASSATKIVQSAAETVRAQTTQSAEIVRQKLEKMGAGEAVGRVSSGARSAVGSVSQSRAAQKFSETTSKLGASRVAQGVSRSVSLARDALLNDDDDDEKLARKDGSSPGVSGSSALAVREEDTAWGKFQTTRVGQSMLAVKEKIEQSNNPVVRATREVLYRTSDALSNLASRVVPVSESAVAVEEIRRLDPAFDPERLRRRLEKYILPDVMKALSAHDLNALKSLVGERVHGMLESRALPEGTKKVKVIDISPLELLSTKIVDREPTLFFTYTAQQVVVDEAAIFSSQYIWSVQRDPKDPTMWVIADMAILDPQEQMF